MQRYALSISIAVLAFFVMVPAITVMSGATVVFAEDDEDDGDEDDGPDEPDTFEETPLAPCTPGVRATATIYEADGTVDEDAAHGGEIWAAGTLNGQTYYSAGKKVLTVNPRLERGSATGSGLCEGTLKSLGVGSISPATLSGGQISITMKYCITGTAGTGAGCPEQEVTGSFGPFEVEADPSSASSPAASSTSSPTASSTNAAPDDSADGEPVEVEELGPFTVDESNRVVAEAMEQGATFSITGTAQPNETVTLTVYSTPQTYETIADSTGHWSVAIATADLEPGPHTVGYTTASSLSERTVLTFRIAAAAEASDTPRPSRSWLVVAGGLVVLLTVVTVIVLRRRSTA